MAVHESVRELIGRTPIVRLESASRETGAQLYAKLEGYNLTGSVKDRAARYILERGLAEGRIDRDTLVVESSSGNFGIALAFACRSLGVRFRCITDVNATSMNRFLIEQAGAELEVVSEPDASGGYLHTRIRRVLEILRSDPSAFWTNQYASAWNWEAHYHGTAQEIHADMMPRVDHVFVAVSSGGTLMGCARFFRERAPGVRIVAVDVRGSVIFGGAPSRRHIPGIGSSRVPEILDPSLVDDVVEVDEEAAVRECWRLLREESLFVGGSAGAVSAAMRAYPWSSRPRGRTPVAVAIFADRGERYFDGLYDARWIAARFPRIATASRRAASDPIEIWGEGLASAPAQP